ncbi:hypothetical protein [Oceanibacterium hippocampi]|uniref:PEGA domain-containing protein n=1 Tax=Oceanibacterium hippocampi TaxID=745714 RepID=A0A1Y5TVM1_9PROT|nr:hypothetical protein [Oceanibacterium hippocampi]SLN69471.1 hypothetical protein OCH7691_03200 [Oceanibacterium hippocampi]
MTTNPFPTLARGTILAIASVGLSACATLVEGTDQTLTVITDPSGATCRLERDGTAIAVVNPTPGSVKVDKDKDQITILCQKDGFQESGGVLSSKFQGMTFGNILFGGLIGVAIDAGSGAMHEYPDSLTIRLIPASFVSIEERDAFFDTARADIVSASDTRATAIRDTCDPNNPAVCEDELKEAEESRESALRDIEAKRTAALIVPAIPAASAGSSAATSD